MKEFQRGYYEILYDFSTLFKVMKITLLFMIVCLMHLSAETYSQEIIVDFSGRGITIEEAVTEMEKQLNYSFFYNRQDVDDSRRVDIDLKNADLKEFVEIVFGKDFKYRLVDDLIVISRKDSESPQIKNIIIKGVVRDQSGEPLPGATVVLKDSEIGVATDVDGNYSITIPEGKHILVFSMIGMKTIEEPVNDRTVINVILEDSIEEMKEVVITGIFTKARESYTGAVTTITSEEMRKVGNRSILTQIRNLDPSFNLVEDNTYGSDPNRLPDIQLRGNTSLGAEVKDLQTDLSSQYKSNLPLFIMDGFEISLEQVMDMDDNLIESITILKDASATAMYGSRGANGVIVITQSRPKIGKLRVTYRGNLNIEAPDLTSYNLLNAREKLAYEIAAGIYDYADFSPSLVQDRKELYNQRLWDIERGVDTYWLKYPVRTGLGQKHSIRVDGGDQNVRYAASLNYNNVLGAMKKSDRKTLSGNFFLNYRYNNLSFQNELTITDNKSNNSPYGSFSTYTKLNPYWKPYDDDGNLVKVLENYYVSNQYRWISEYNPLYNAFLPYKDQTQYLSLQNNFAIEWDIISDLKIRARYSFKKLKSRSDYYLSRDHTNFAEYEDEDYDRKGKYVYTTKDEFNYEGELTVNYNGNFKDKHQVYFGLSANFAEDKSEQYRIEAEGFPGSGMIDLGLANQYAKEGSPVTYDEISRRMGFIGNLNFTFDRRYFIDVSGKLEGSSKFGSDKKIAPFWSMGLGWNLHNEMFLRENKNINSLRLRLSYGITGSQNFNPYQALTSYSYINGENYRGMVGTKLIALGNKELKWQQTNQINLGIETILFESRFRLTIDVYNKLTDDLLSDITLPTSAGFNSFKANIGKVRNRGVELSTNIILWRPMSNDLIWSLGGSLAHNKNKILKISNSLEFLNNELNEEAGSNPSFLFKEGQSINTIFVVESLGIDPSNGKEIFVKQDGTKTYTWDADDKVPFGTTDPKVWGNFNTMFRYKDVSFNMVFNYRLGGYIYNQTLIDKVENVDPWLNADKRVFYDRWKEPGDDVFFKDIKNRTTTRASSRFVQKENSLSCTSINLNYDINQEWSKRKLGIDYISIGLYTEDVFRFSTIKQERGTDYPFARKYSMALTVRF